MIRDYCRIISIAVVMCAVLVGCSEPHSPTFSGLSVGDIEARLRRDWGMAFVTRSYKDGYTAHGTRKDRSGAELSCKIMYYSDTEIHSVNYSVDWIDASVKKKKTVDMTVIKKLAQRYFLDCVSIPCKDIDSIAAKKAILATPCARESSRDYKIGSATLRYCNDPYSCSSSTFSVVIQPVL